MAIQAIRSVIKASLSCLCLNNSTTTKKGITPIDRSIIDRCVSLVYEEARETKTIPTLKTLRSML
ncbi:hypothetical protein [Faecalicoccus pleomorphus]|uniref:hypothetical protein n=1 Tax=Faecalicoccus pleomorphus TaxID=1323 RepID=UPI003DA7CA57